MIGDNIYNKCIFKLTAVGRFVILCVDSKDRSKKVFFPRPEIVVETRSSTISSSLVTYSRCLQIVICNENKKEFGYGILFHIIRHAPVFSKALIVFLSLSTNDTDCVFLPLNLGAFSKQNLAKCLLELSAATLTRSLA